MTRIYIEPHKSSARYRVRLHKPDGAVIIEATTRPLLDAARIVLAMRITGTIEIRPYARMTGSIERLAATGGDPEENHHG